MGKLADEQINNLKGVITDDGDDDETVAEED